MQDINKNIVAQGRLIPIVGYVLDGRVHVAIEDKGVLGVKEFVPDAVVRCQRRTGVTVEVMVREYEVYFSFPIGSDKGYDVIAAACDFATTLSRESQRSRQAHPAGVGVAKQKPRYKNVAPLRRK